MIPTISSDPGVLPDMHCALFVNGRVLDLAELRPEDVRVDEIAETLAKINRYAGRTPYPYSVAQHAVLVSALIERFLPGEDRLAYEGLHHDDTEAFCGDILGPVKRNLDWVLPNMVHGDQEPPFAWFEQRIREAVAKKLGLADMEPVYVKEADMLALRLEQYFLQGRQEISIPAMGGMDWQHMLRPLHWRKARDEYMDAHLVLLPEPVR